MTSISKNIYNCTLYCYKVYKQFEDNIYKDLYDDIIKNKYVEKLGDVINKNKIKKTDILIYMILFGHGLPTSINKDLF